MTITAVAEPLNAPPRNAVTVAAPVGSVMSSVAVWRIVNGARTDLRTQPAAGFDSRTVYDYECPYGVSATYGWSATFTDPTSYTTVWNETWANVSAWTVEYGTWTAVSGKARSGTGGGQLSRLVSAGKYRVTLDSLSNPPSVVGAFAVAVAFFEDISTIAFSVQRRVGGAIWVVSGFGESATTIDPALPIVVDITATTIRVWNAGGSFTILRATTIMKIMLVDSSNSVGALFGPVKIQAYPAPSVIAETSAAVMLSPVDGWLVHPASPAKSFRIQRGNTSYAELVSLDDVENPSKAVEHEILGSRLPITTTNGERSSDRTGMVIRSYTAAAVSDLMTLLRDEVPVLATFPPSWLLDFSFAFYQVGDVKRAHTVHSSRYPYRDVSLPLVEVASPIVDVQGSGWSYAAVVVAITSYEALIPTFATYADMATNTRS